MTFNVITTCIVLILCLCHLHLCACLKLAGMKARQSLCCQKENHTYSRLVCMRVHAYMCVCMCVRACVRARARVCVCVCVCACGYHEWTTCQVVPAALHSHSEGFVKNSGIVTDIGLMSYVCSCIVFNCDMCYANIV